MLPSSKVVPFETEVCESRPPLWMNRTIAVGRHGCVIPEAPAREPWGVVTIVLRLLSPHCTTYLFAMSETQEQWNNRQAIELLAQHIPFERDMGSKAEQIEMLRGLVIRHGRNMDPDLFGFEARSELVRLGLWDRIGPEQPE